MPIETNSFKITGLDDLKITYRLFQIVGLRRDGMDYYGNVQKLSRRLSSQMRAPVTTYERNDETFARDMANRPARSCSSAAWLCCATRATP